MDRENLEIPFLYRLFFFPYEVEYWCFKVSKLCGLILMVLHWIYRLYFVIFTFLLILVIHEHGRNPNDPWTWEIFLFFWCNPYTANSTCTWSPNIARVSPSQLDISALGNSCHMYFLSIITCMYFSDRELPFPVGVAFHQTPYLGWWHIT